MDRKDTLAVGRGKMAQKGEESSDSNYALEKLSISKNKVISDRKKLIALQDALQDPVTYSEEL